MPLNYLEDDEDLLPPIDEEDQPFVGPRRPFDRNTLAKSAPPPPSLPNAPDVGGDVPPEMRRIIGVNAPMDKLPASEAPVVRSREDAENAYAKAVGAAPSQPKPKWWQRLAAGAVGAAAGYTNAAGRTRPIDATAAERGILAPGYDRKVAEWKQGVTSADATRNAAKANEEAWWKNRQLNTAEEREEAQSARDRAQATYFDETRAGQLKERQQNDQARIAQAKDSAFVKGREDDAMLIDPAKDPAPQGYLTQPSAANPGMVLAVPPRMMPLTPELAPYALGYAVGQQIPWSRFKAAQDAANKDTLQQNKPSTRPDIEVQAETRSKLADQYGLKGRDRETFILTGQIHQPPAALQLGGMLAGNQDAVTTAATQYRQTRTMPPIGRNPMMAVAILKRVAEMDKQDGLSPEQSGVQAEIFKANRSALADITKRESQVSTMERTAGKNLDLFLQQAQKVADSGIVPVNRMFRGAQKAFGDPNMAAFEAARITAFTEISRVLSGSMANVLSDSARKEAEGVLRGDYTLPQLMRVAQTLRTDMKNRMDSFAEQRQALAQQMENRPVQASEGGRGGQQATGGRGGGQPAVAGNPNPNGYVVGHVYRGLTYLGGDPNQQSSWKK